MKIALFSHCAIDSITIGDSNYEQIGGAACYGGITARKLNFDVELVTKFGPDFPQKQYLSDNKINFQNALSEKKTTQFSINITGADRTLKLKNECEPIEYSPIKADGFLVSPIFHEISLETFEKIKQNSNYLLLDPQGFLRRTDAENNVVLKDTDVDLTKVDSIKVNPEEALHLTGSTDTESLKLLQKKGVEHVILTNKTEVSMLVKERIYSITLPNKKIYDTTGVGDIFLCNLLLYNAKRERFPMGFMLRRRCSSGSFGFKRCRFIKNTKKGDNRK